MVDEEFSMELVLENYDQVQGDVERLQAELDKLISREDQLKLDTQETITEVESTAKLAELTTELSQMAKKEADEAHAHLSQSLRTGYFLLAGMGRMMGGGLTSVFMSMYLAGRSAIRFQATMVKAMAQVPGMQVQAVLAGISLGFAALNLGAILTGQRELAGKVRGFNMMLNGLGRGLSSYTMRNL